MLFGKIRKIKTLNLILVRNMAIDFITVKI